MWNNVLQNVGGQYFIPVMILMMLILFAFDIYFVRSLLKHLRQYKLNRHFTKAIWVFTFLMFVILIFVNYIRLNHRVGGQFLEYSLLIISIWYLPKLIITPFILMKDIILKLRQFSINHKTSYSKAHTNQINPARRKMIQNTGWILAGIPFFGVIDGAIRTTTNHKVTPIDIHLAKLSQKLNGFRIVQISDLHAGSILSNKSIIELSFIIDSLKPDIITITGDFVNFSPDEFDRILPLLRNFRTQNGVYACLGNHDRYMTMAEHETLVNKIRDCGIDLLINQNKSIEIAGEKIQIAGIDNSSYGTQYGDINKTVSGLQEYLPTVLLCHDPNQWDDIREKCRFIDLTLSGHTHGGQIGFNIFNNDYSVAKVLYKYNSGLYKSDEQYLYINRGIGTIGPPLRIGIEPEITLITLHSIEQLA
jgi:predicted MPP superfamily phosphohydrolase